MAETTIVTSSPVGRQLSDIKKGELSYLMFNKKKIELVAKITIGRDSDNIVVVDDKLASRHHCVIQKIKDDYFLKDENSTNGTFHNGSRIPPDKYVRLNPGDRITVGGSTIVMS
jgi:pSer/pThr/pTyr-binding forkhead associated (FHA) protein